MSYHSESIDGRDDHDDHVDALSPDEAMDAGEPPESQKILHPLTPEALAAFEEAQRKAGIVYISRIPPGMRPQKLRQILSAHGEIGRAYLVPEDPKRAQMRKSRTHSKQVRFIEGWVEFTDKKVARSVASMLNAQPIGGKRGSRYKDDVWTMKYLPKFKWNMLSEQLRQEQAAHTARVRIELAQSKQEQEDYLKQVSLGRKLEDRAKRKKKTSSDSTAWSNAFQGPSGPPRHRQPDDRKVASSRNDEELDAMLDQIF